MLEDFFGPLETNQIKTQVDGYEEGGGIGCVCAHEHPHVRVLIVCAMWDTNRECR